MPSTAKAHLTSKSKPRFVGKAGGLPGVHSTELARSVYSGSVTAMLREAIVEGTLGAGDPLVETRLAEELAVSRGPVRSALQALESEGLVKTLRNGRTIVVGFGDDDLRDLIAVRYETETLAMTWGVERNRDTAPVVAAYEALEAGAATPAVVDLDLEFHRALVEFSGSRYLVQSWLSMVPVLHTVITIGNRRLIARESLPNSERIIMAHRALLDAVLARDPALAATVLGAQLKLAASRYGNLPPPYCFLVPGP